MCGIAGVFSSRLSPRKAAACLPDMLQSIIHRGPDAEGIWSEESLPLALGHRRLSILDLSATGAQPMHSASGRYVITYNGEIYNHLEIRERLAGRGISWQGTSDTETLLAAIECLGLDDALQIAVGMFAFALWDRRERKLSLARDRFGEKPLYFYLGNSDLVFGSDLASIERFPGFDRQIDPLSVHHYFHRGWHSPEHTIWASVKKVVPGGIVEFDQSLEARPRPYWLSATEISGAYQQLDHLSEADALDRLDTALTQSVQRQLISDVPIGAWLSGGVDSSLVVALMQKLSATATKTFSIGFADSDYDESAFAEAVAAHLGTDHTCAILEPRQVTDLVPRLPGIFSEPFSDASQLPTILLAQMTREHVTVALTGDGGDELFGGYNRYVSANSAARIRKTAAGLGRFALQSAAVLPPALLRHLARLTGQNTLQFEDKYRKLLGLLQANNESQFYFAALERNHQQSLLSYRFETANGAMRLPEELAQLDAAHQLMYLDTCLYMPENVLVKVDRSAMAASLETRAPFLDPDIFKLAWQLPPSQKLRSGQNKRILRRLLLRYLPDDLVNRPKQGFTPPIGRWLAGPLRDWGQSILTREKLEQSPYLDAVAVQSAWTALLEGDSRFVDSVWDTIVFLSWCDSRGLAR